MKDSDFMEKTTTAENSCNANPVLCINNLTKCYAKQGVNAIEDISFEIGKGEIVGLVGHNGAGKSTTLKCLTGMLPYRHGEIRIMGHDMKSEPLKAKAHLGFVSDNHAVFENMTGLEYLHFIANIFGVSKEDREERIASLEGVFQLGDKVNDLISSYSHGMKQKICMMASLVHMPSLWILDEPMLGLDPSISRAVLDFMRAYVREGNTILFSSHNLSVVKDICTRVVVIKNGRLRGDIDLVSDSDFDLEAFFMDEDSTYEEFVSKMDAKMALDEGIE